MYSFLSVRSHQKREPTRLPEPQHGVAKHHLNTPFSTLPEKLSLLKNCHVLYVYMCSDGCRSQTGRILKSQFSAEHFPTVVNSRIKSLLSRSLYRFKRLSIPKQFQSFDGICWETFNCGVSYPTERTSVEDATDKHHVPRLSILTDHAMTHSKRWKHNC